MTIVPDPEPVGRFLRPHPPAAIFVSYLARGARKWKRFDDPYAARRFYAAKLKAGAEPRVVRVAL